MKLTRMFSACLLIAGILLCTAVSVWAAGVPVRVSIKFILDANGNRPATGNLNTDAEINAEVGSGNRILRSNFTEFQIEVIEFVDLSGVSQHYTANINNDTQFWNLRTDAMNNAATYHWRNDAINIYINGGSGSARSVFPPDNDYILMNQGCNNTPSCILHELGHSFNLMHTHEGGGADGCSDTIADNDAWTKDQIAQNNFGTTYANLTAAQQDQVNLVFNNVMSYHVSEPQLRLSFCQMTRTSTQLDNDRARLLSLIPVYVDGNYGGRFGENGRFTTPYNSLQEALNAGIGGKVVVLQQGIYTTTQETIGGNAQMVTRSGPSEVRRLVIQGAQLYVLPVDLENSKTPAVSKAVRAAQDEDKAARKALKDAEESAGLVQTREEKAALKREGDEKAKVHAKSALEHLEEAQKHATADEKLAVQFELAQRYQHAGDCEAAAAYYKLVAEGTDQEHLRTDALRRAGECSKSLEGPAALPSENDSQVHPGK